MANTVAKAGLAIPRTGWGGVIKDESDEPCQPIFNMMPETGDGDGRIDAVDLQKFLSTFNCNFSLQELEAFINDESCQPNGVCVCMSVRACVCLCVQRERKLFHGCTCKVSVSCNLFLSRQVLDFPEFLNVLSRLICGTLDVAVRCLD